MLVCSKGERESRQRAHFKRCWPRKAERVSAGVPSALGTRNRKGLGRMVGLSTPLDLGSVVS